MSARPLFATSGRDPQFGLRDAAMERTGIEPVTFGLQSRRSPS